MSLSQSSSAASSATSVGGAAAAAAAAAAAGPLSERMEERETVGDYILIDKLGKGGFGYVYKALHRVKGNTVAIKQLSLERASKEVFASLQQEIQLLKSLRHANIVRYIDHVVNTKTNQLYIAMEYVENGSLAQMVKKYGKFPESLARTYVAKIVDGLVYLHEQGVIHRDVKGANILIDKDGVVKLADFGVATKIKASAASAELGENVAVGTPYFMAPEVITFQGIKPQSDVWSLGCTIIEMLSGEPPYASSSPFSAMYRMVEDDHPPFPSGISPALENFLLQCFQKNVDLRLTARELRNCAWLKPAYEDDTDAAKPAAAAAAAATAPPQPQPKQQQQQNEQRRTTITALPPHTLAGAGKSHSSSSAVTSSTAAAAKFTAAMREVLDYNEALHVVRSQVPAKAVATPDDSPAAAAAPSRARVPPQTAPHQRHVSAVGSFARPRSGTLDDGLDKRATTDDIDADMPVRRQSLRGGLSQSSFTVLPDKANDVRSDMRKALMSRFAPKTSLDRFKERNMRDEWDNDYLPPENSDDSGSGEAARQASEMRTSSGSLPRRAHVRRRVNKAGDVPAGASPAAAARGVKIAALRTASEERELSASKSARLLLSKSAHASPAKAMLVTTARKPDTVAKPAAVAAAAADDDDENWDAEFATTATDDGGSPVSVPVNRSLKLVLDTTPPKDDAAAAVKKRRVRRRKPKPGAAGADDDWQSVSSDGDASASSDEAAPAAAAGAAPSKPAAAADEDDFDADFGDIGFGKFKDKSKVSDWGELLAPKLAKPKSSASVASNKSASDSNTLRASDRLSQYKETDDDDDDFGFDDDDDDDGDDDDGSDGERAQRSTSMAFDDDGDDDDLPAGRGGNQLQLAARFTAASRPVTQSVDLAAEAEGAADWDDTSSDGGSGAAADAHKASGAAAAAERNDAVLREKFQEALLREVLQQIDLLCGSAEADNAATLLGALEHLQRIFAENPGQELLLITNHGLLPLVALIERGVRADVLQRTLELVIEICNEATILSNLCIMGAIPAVMACAARERPAPVRALAARFIQVVICASPQTLQMFIACKGLAALVGLLDADEYEADRALVWSAVSAIETVFRLQHEVSVPRNEFMHLFVNCGFLRQFGPAMHAMLSDHEAPPAQRAAAAGLLMTFARGDTRLKRSLVSADAGFLMWVRNTLDVLPPDDENNLTLLKGLRELSSDSATLRALEIFLERVVQLVNTFVQRRAFPAELFNRAIQFLFHMCRFDRKRQEAAASCGIVPFLLTVIFSNKPAKEFAVPIFTDLARTSSLTRNILWKNDGLRHYLQLTQDQYWHMDALGAIAAWLPHERERLEQALLTPENLGALVGTLRFGIASALVNVLESLESIASLSSLLGAALGRPELGLIELLAPLVQHSNPHVRVNVVKLVVALCRRASSPARLLRRSNLLEAISGLVRTDPSLLVQNIASSIIALANAGDSSPRLDGATTSDTSGRSSPMASPVLSHHSSSSVSLPSLAGGAGASPSASPRAAPRSAAVADTPAPVPASAAAATAAAGAVVATPASLVTSTGGDMRRGLEHLKHTPQKAVVWIDQSELKLCELLGSGAAGSVYRGYYREHEVAIKELKEGEDDAERLEEFRKEFAILSAMDHPSLILLYGCSIKPRLRMVMEFAPGGSLDSLLSNETVDFTWELLFKLMSQLCQAVNVLHQWTPQILHRDIKPLNLLLTRNRDLKLGDFGLSRFNSDSAAATLGKIRGTMAYTAPEAYAGAPYTTKSDMYSCGMILWEMTTRCITCKHERPFAEFKNIKFDFQIIMHSAKKHLRPTIPPRTPLSVSAAIERTWHKDVAPRPEALELLSTMQNCSGKYQRHRDTWDQLCRRDEPATAAPAAPPLDRQATIDRIEEELKK